jgi:rhodanese-related sulfurtransferase
MERVWIKGGTVRRAGVVLAVVILMAAGVAQNKIFRLRADLDLANPRLSLADVESTVSSMYPLPEISTAELAGKIGKGEFVVFDVRTQAEFDTSHLAGTIRVAPDMDPKSFLMEHGAQLENRSVVFYCAVGVRSARMLERLMNGIAAYRPAAVYNLRGGIFRWFADGHQVVDASGSTDKIQPFDAAWNGLLNRTLARSK